MKHLKIPSLPLAVACILLCALLFGIDTLFQGERASGNLLYTLIFWTAVVEGSIALVAVAQLAQARWIIPIRQELLSVYPVLLLLCGLSLCLTWRMDLYSWSQSEHGLWLNKNFFLLRNAGLLFLAYLFARKLSIASVQDSESKNVYGVLYVLTFVTSQSLVAFDWVTSLEYPWFSSLFGAYFVIESLRCGVVLAAIVCFLKHRKLQGDPEKVLFRSRRDTTSLMLGFTILWTYLMFVQVNVIWYGNLPEEVSFLARRQDLNGDGQYDPSILVAVVLLFLIPFITLMFKKVRANPLLVMIVGCGILLGLAIEWVVFLCPVASLHPGALIPEFLIMATLFVACILNRLEELSQLLPPTSAASTPACHSEH